MFWFRAITEAAGSLIAVCHAKQIRIHTSKIITLYIYTVIHCNKHKTEIYSHKGTYVSWYHNMLKMTL